MISPEKPEMEVCHGETVSSEVSNTLPPSQAEGVSPTIKSKQEKRLILKQDLLILPLLAMGYFFGYMDRGQIGNARLMGMQKSLNLTNQQYFQALMIFFVGFLAVELPAALLLRIFPAQFVFGGAIMLFGLCATLISTADSFASLMVLRTFLGMGEAILVLGFLYLSLWYRPDELALRSGLIYFSTPFAGFTSGLVAYGVAKNLKSSHGLMSWQWLFIVEGIPTLALALAMLFLLPNLPDKVAEKGHIFFKSPEERNLLLERQKAGQNVANARIRPRQIITGLKDPKSYLGAFAVAAPALGVTAFTIFLPTFIKEFGFSALDAQLYTIIPYSFAIVSTPLICYLSDWLRMRAFPLILCLVISIIGFVILLATTSSVARIAGCCFVAAGAYPGVSVGAAWVTNMHGGYTKRSTAFAICQLFVQGYSIIGTEIYNQPPRFFKGHGILLGLYMLALVSTVVLYFWLKRENARRDTRAAARVAAGEEEKKLDDEHGFENLCDYHPDWRYPL